MSYGDDMGFGDDIWGWLDPSNPGPQEPPPLEIPITGGLYDETPPYYNQEGPIQVPDAVLAQLPTGTNWADLFKRGGSALWSALSQLPQGAMNLLKPFMPTGGGPPGSGGNGDKMDPMLLAAAMTGAWNHYKDADRYITQSEKYAGQMDPFGDQRKGWQYKLHQLMDDPQGYLKNDPGYQSTLKLALDPAASQMRSKGYGNSGNILSELTKLSGDVTNKYLGAEKDRLAHWGGADIGPGAAGDLLRTGLQGSIDSRNAALGDIFAGLRGSGVSGGINDWISRLFGNGGGDGGFNVAPPPAVDEYGRPVMGPPDPEMGPPNPQDEGPQQPRNTFYDQPTGDPYNPYVPPMGQPKTMTETMAGNFGQKPRGYM